MRLKTNFLKRFKLIWVVQSSSEKYSASRKPQINGFIRAVHYPKRGALRDRHERWVGNAVDAIGRETSDFFADGEVVWSWRPDAGVKFAGIDPLTTVAKEPGHRGEHEGNRKTIARGKPEWPVNLW